MSKLTPAEQGEPLPYNHHLQEFLSFLKQERGFAEATIVNRKRSLKPFLAWLSLQGIPLSTVSPVVITKYFTGARCEIVGIVGNVRQNKLTDEPSTRALQFYFNSTHHFSSGPKLSSQLLQPHMLNLRQSQKRKNPTHLI